MKPEFSYIFPISFPNVLKSESDSHIRYSFGISKQQGIEHSNQLGF